MDLRRVRLISDGKKKDGAIAYWMSRDCRVEDNWALIFAVEKAKELKCELYVFFCLTPKFLDATLRQYGFLIEGLQEVERDLVKKNIPFFVLLGEPEKEVEKFVKKENISALVTDFNPLKISQNWKHSLSKKLDIPFYEVDAHNIVPCFYVSSKQEYGAYTLRPKIKKVLKEFLVEFPKIKSFSYNKKKSASIDWRRVRASIRVDASVKEVSFLKPGAKAAKKRLLEFIKIGLASYAVARNDLSKEATSLLSAYLHFGHIASQRVALDVLKSEDSISKEAFLEELIVRKELADNFCFYQKNYDNPKGFPMWARETLFVHQKDKRDYLYSKKEFEEAKTADPIWNNAQLQLVKTGRMAGYLRMYWAKKILEWSLSAAQAMKIAIYLNDKYELDGRDPNGYAGIAWAIGGVHDRAWQERKVFGKIRYMGFNCIKNKIKNN